MDILCCGYHDRVIWLPTNPADNPPGAAVSTMATEVVGPPSDHGYQYDLIVIGGGSGGVACAKKASLMGKKVACLDYVTESTQGTLWGLGGTCVNVGCIPKKLMHQAALLGYSLEDAEKFGWSYKQEDYPVTHSWDKMKINVQDHISALNWTHRVQLREKGVAYYNYHAEFLDKHKIRAHNHETRITHKTKIKEFTAETFVLAVGGRPKLPDNIPGAKAYAITSDDLFSLPYCPGKTLMVGASYIALECAGFLTGVGLDVTVMVRSILLRGFDQQIAELIRGNLIKHGVKFVGPCEPIKVEKLKDANDKEPGLFKVTSKMKTGEELIEEFNTVMFATGRYPFTKGMNLEEIGVKLNKDGFVKADDKEQTSVPNIYAIGDVLEGKPQLTPVAVRAGQLLCRRLYQGSNLKTDYINVPTTIFTPLEYGCIGFSEEDAIAKYGEDKLEIYHTQIWPLEYTVAKRPRVDSYLKLICILAEDEKVIGFHYLGPNAGEITQGFALGMRLGATKADYDALIGIHPTCAEAFTNLRVTKRSGESIRATGC